MSEWQVIRHTDTDAPPLYGYSKGSFHAFLEKIMLLGYNPQSVLSYTRVGQVVTLQFQNAHGYKIAQLLQISGSGYDPLEGNFRITGVPTTTSLTLYIKNPEYELIPSSDFPSLMTTKNAPLGWERVYSSATQSSYRSLSDLSSKLVVSFYDSPFNAHCYMVDISKDLDVNTGAVIDSTSEFQKASYETTGLYFVVSTNGNNLQTASNWNHESFLSPYTIVGNGSMVYILNYPFTDSVSENGSYRQLDPTVYNGYSRAVKLSAFGDYTPLNTAEYQTGSCFYFKFYNYLNAAEHEGNINNPEVNNPLVRFDYHSTNSYDCYFSAYNSTGVRVPAKVVPGGFPPVPNYAYSGGSYLQAAYPERVHGGVTTCKWYAYSADPSNAAPGNSPLVFLKGEFPCIRGTCTNMTNVGNAPFIQRFVVPIESNPTGFLVFHSNNSGNWQATGGHLGVYTFELD